MTEYDRGAYTPQTDAPLAFDARRPSGGGRSFPTTLVVSLGILAVLIGAVVLFYRSGVRSKAEGPVAVGAPVAQIKAPAPNQPQAGDEATGLQIYKTEGSPAATPAAPAFSPPPEEPLARPTAPVAAQPITTPAPAPAPPTAAATAIAASGATTTAKPAASAPPKDAVAALLDTPAPVATKPAAKAKPPVATTAVATAAPAAKAAAASVVGGAVAQIGAYSSQTLAAKGWSDVSEAFAADMSGKGKHFEPVVAQDGKTLYRAAVTGFASKADAQAFCTKLKAAKRACIVK